MITTAAEDVKPAVAYLREIIRPGNREPFLYQSKVSEHRFYEDFAEFAADFVGAAGYPAPQSNKFETHSFAPTIFWEGEYRPRSRPDAEPKFGFYRTGESCVGEIYLGYFDVDNHTDNPVVTIDEIEAVLTALGVSHVLYTSYSHLKKEGRHKVRIITPISREVTYDEMFQVFTVFNHLFHYQL
uniref:hypothetical protein n=1 Tax=Methylobacterium sp. B34 TaxID=95563 RepID=UPI0011AEBD7D